MNYNIDATNKSLGRIASEAASILMGKNTVEFTRNNLANQVVTITNVSKVKLDPAKLLNKTYKSFSGYPGGLKETTMAKMIEKKGYKEILNIAVKGMLPNNRLRNAMMKNLIISE